MKLFANPNDYILDENYKSPEFNQCAIRSESKANKIISSQRQREMTDSGSPSILNMISPQMGTIDRQGFPIQLHPQAIEDVNTSDGMQMRPSEKNDQTASFEIKSMVTPKNAQSDTKTSQKIQLTHSPPQSSEFNLKETNSDEQDENFAIVQVPKPLQPFENQSDSDDSCEDQNQ